jgi:hemoglobin/transferrin/lactoferrin receptor protein
MSATEAPWARARTLTFACTAAMALLAPPTPAAAHAEDSIVAAGPVAIPTGVDEIVVTTTRLDVPPAMTPAAVSLVPMAELALTHSASSFPDALSRVPGVMVQKTTRGFGSPYLRGFTGFRALTLVDGIRLNNSTFRDGPNQYDGTIDLFDVAWVEVNRGPGSVLHGSDAVGGRLQVVPRFARPGTDDPGTFRAWYRGATQEASQAAHLSYDAGGEAWAATLGGTYRAMGDLRAGDGTGRQINTGFDEAGLNGNATLDLAPGARLILGGQFFGQDDVSRYHRTVDSPGWQGTEPGTDLRNLFDQERILAYARLSFETGAALANRGRATVSFHRQVEENDRVSSSSARTLQGFDVDAYGLDVQLTAGLGRHLVTYGFEGYLDVVDSSRTVYAADGSVSLVDVQGPIGDDATYWNLGGYLQDRFSPTADASLQAGIRYNFASLAANRVRDPVTGGAVAVSDSWSAVVGEARAMHDLGGSAQVYAAISQGFRAPNLSDMTTFDLAEQGQVELPSFDLSPERFLSYEVGLKSSGTSLAGGIALFRTEIRDMIDRYFSGETITLPSGQPASVVRKANVSDGFVQGIEIEGEVRLHRALSIGGFFFWTFGEADTTVVDEGGARLERYPLSRVAPPTGEFHVRWAPARGAWMEVEVQAAARQDRLSLKDTKDTTRIPPGGTPGYAVLNLRGGLRVGGWMELLASLRNLTDEDYRIHGSGINEPGFGVEIGARFALRP